MSAIEVFRAVKDSGTCHLVRPRRGAAGEYDARPGREEERIVKYGAIPTEIGDKQDNEGRCVPVCTGCGEPIYEYGEEHTPADCLAVLRKRIEALEAALSRLEKKP